ncbi:MAG: hypothetical protein A2W25_09020 [candidate division Zixibacteria bacterium RBG_16_53_22]|nr:MAG: hypothetical protein A2W25_09020 [candidate division Zixibacteria bacterium RBG_16_53_22]
MAGDFESKMAGFLSELPWTLDSLAVRTDLPEMLLPGVAGSDSVTLDQYRTKIGEPAVNSSLSM